MSLSALLDCQARVWRLAETLGFYQESRHGFAPDPVYTLSCTAKRSSYALTNPGPGLQETGFRTVYFAKGPRFVQRDLIEIFSGPHAPAWLEVEDATYPRGHHVEVRCVPYHGPTPEVAS